MTAPTLPPLERITADALREAMARASDLATANDRHADVWLIGRITKGALAITLAGALPKLPPVQIDGGLSKLSTIPPRRITLRGA